VAPHAAEVPFSLWHHDGKPVVGRGGMPVLAPNIASAASFPGQHICSI